MDNSDVDKFKYRGSAFCYCFVNHFCIVLDRYTKIISNGKKDKDPGNDLVNGLGWLIGGAVGAAAGPLVSAVGMPIAAGTSVRVGGNIGTMGIRYLHNKFSYSKKAKTVVHFVDNGTIQQLEYFDPAEQRRLLVHVLVEAALHIFAMFEYQFMKVSNNGMDRMACDAACRAVNYIVEHSDEDPTFSASVFIKGVLQGISKKSKFAKVTASLLGQEGLNVTTDTGSKWNTAKLFSEVGVIASNCVYVKHELDESLGTRLPANLTDFEPCETDTQLQLWLRRNGFTKYDWTMENDFVRVASDDLLSEIGEGVIQRFKAGDLELRLDNIDRQLNDIKSTVSSNVSSKEISFKPISEPHALFTGRNDFVDAAVKYLTIVPFNVPAVQIQFPCLVIYALGGYGKTQTAKKIASNCRRGGEFQHFIWIDAENDTSIWKSFFAVMQHAGLAPSNEVFDSANIGTPLLHKFYDLLVGRTGERFLIIFDNVENFDQILQFLPLNYAPPNISVLMTSQRQCQIQESYGYVKNQSLDVILPDEAMAFVEKILGTQSLDSEEEKKLLVEQSGRIPLVLHIMTSTIKFQRKYKANCGIAQCLTEMMHKPVEYSDRSNKFDLNYRKSLTEIVRFTISKINAMDEPEGKIAVKFFDRAVYCSPTGNFISSFVETYLKDMQEEMDNVHLNYPTKINASQMIQMAIELLCEFSLVKISGARFSVHRLIQTSRRLDLKASGDEKVVLEKLISNCDCVRLGIMTDSENAIPIWYHVADYADLTNKFYVDKGSLTEFTLRGANDLVKKIVQILGLARSVESIVSNFETNTCSNQVDDYTRLFPSPIEVAILSDNQEMIDFYTKTILKYKTDEPEQFAKLSYKITEIIPAVIGKSFTEGNSTLHVLKKFVSTLNIDIRSRSAELITKAVRVRKLDVLTWLVNENSCIPQKDHLHSCFEYPDRDIFSFILTALEKLDPNIDLIHEIQIKPTVELLLHMQFNGSGQESNEILRILLKKGLHPEIKDGDGWNAIHHATWEGNFSAIDLMLTEHRYPCSDPARWRSRLIESMSNKGWTPLMCAARIGSCETTTALLEKYSANIHATDLDGWTALFHAIDVCCLPVVKILLSHGALTNNNMERGMCRNALHLAVTNIYINEEIVEAILASKDCDVNGIDDDGNNVLHILVRQYYACRYEHNNYVLYLLLKANPLLLNDRNNDRLTPVELAKYLIETGKYCKIGLNEFISQLDI